MLWGCCIRVRERVWADSWERIVAAKGEEKKGKRGRWRKRKKENKRSEKARGKKRGRGREQG
eukprot:223594-Amorphochlora_amoeboformis.AAC.1